MEKLYYIKGVGKVNKIQACDAIIKSLLKSHDDCLGFLDLIRACKKSVETLAPILEASFNEELLSSPKLEKVHAKFEKEKAFQQKIIENKDFDALVKDVNKTIKFSKLFNTAMMNAIEKCSKNIKRENLNDKYQQLLTYEMALKESVKIFEDQIKFSTEQKNEEFNASLDDYERENQ